MQYRDKAKSVWRQVTMDRLRRWYETFSTWLKATKWIKQTNFHYLFYFLFLGFNFNQFAFIIVIFPKGIKCRNQPRAEISGRIRGLKARDGHNHVTVNVIHTQSRRALTDYQEEEQQFFSLNIFSFSSLMTWKRFFLWPTWRLKPDWKNLIRSSEEREKCKADKSIRRHTGTATTDKDCWC